MERPERKESFILHTSQYECIEDLPVEDKAALLDAIYRYAISGEVGQLPVGASVAFKFIRRRLDEDYEKYQKICERNRSNGNKGGRPRKVSAQETQENPENPLGYLETQENPKKPKKTLTDTDTDTDTDTELSEDNSSSSDATASSSTAVEATEEVVKPTKPLTRKEAPIDYQGLCDYWNERMRGKAISQIRSLSKQRQAAVNSRIKEHGKQAIQTVIDKAAASDFLNGAGGKAWVASFDWIFLHTTNFQKVLEGNYDNKATGQSAMSRTAQAAATISSFLMDD